MEEKNMKKTYIIPTVKVVKVKTIQMLTTSTLGVNSSQEQELNTGEILSRGTKGDMWDDEEEDY